MLGTQKQEIVLIWLLGLLWFSNDSNTCACQGCLCGVNIVRTILFYFLIFQYPFVSCTHYIQEANFSQGKLVCKAIVLRATLRILFFV